jgi:hypothetical protein
LIPGHDKQPDAHWTINPEKLPNQQQQINTLAINPADGDIAPQLVFEVAVHNDTMPQLTQTDLNNYFAPGTGTRAWVGIKVWVHTTNNHHTWWAGWATRAKDANGQWVDQALFMPGSMPILSTHNASIYDPVPQLVFPIDVDELIHPCQRPVPSPRYLNINLERIRLLIVRKLG